MNRPVHEEESRTTQPEPVDNADSSGAWSRTGRRVEVLVRKGASLHHGRRDGPQHLLHRAQRMVGVGAGKEEAACGELEEAAGEAPDVNRRAVLRAEDELRRAVQPATQLSPSDHVLFSKTRPLCFRAEACAKQAAAGRQIWKEGADRAMM